jgi:hypothetical protein
MADLIIYIFFFGGCGLIGWVSTIHHDNIVELLLASLVGAFGLIIYVVAQTFAVRHYGSPTRHGINPAGAFDGITGIIWAGVTLHSFSHIDTILFVVVIIFWIICFWLLNEKFDWWRRKRNLFFGIWLAIVFSYNFYVVMICLLIPIATTIPIVSKLFEGLFSLIGLPTNIDLPNYKSLIVLIPIIFNVIFLLALYNRKKIGFYGYLISSIIYFLVVYLMGFEILGSLIGLVCVTIMFLSLFIGKERKDWSMLN